MTKFLVFFLILVRVCAADIPDFVQKEILSLLSLEEGREYTAGYLYLPRERSIDGTTHLYVKYALEFFEKEKVSFVVLDLDTPGGEVFAALKISEELKRCDAKHKIPVVAYVDDWALSAGALLAYSCRIIGGVKEASMGAAEPILVSSDGKPEKASEKMVSVLRVEFAKTAELYGRNPLIAEAMVDSDVVLVLREGTVVKLLSDAQIEPNDRVINAKGKLLTLDAKGMKDLGVANFIAGEKGEESAPGSVRFLSYSDRRIDFFAFLSHPFVSSVLIMGLMIGLYGLIQSGGMGISSMIGLICFALLILSSFSEQLIGVLDVLLLSAGLLLLTIDLFFLSGFGWVGAIGILLFLAGLVGMLLPSLRGVDFSWDPTHWDIRLAEWVHRLSLFLGTIFFSILMIGSLGKFWFKRGTVFKRLILQSPPSFSKENEKEIPDGAVGIAFSSLRPFGKVQVDDRIVEAQTEGELIRAGSKVLVVGRVGSRLLVREIV